jgi:hypothetical protein
MKQAKMLGLALVAGVLLSGGGAGGVNAGEGWDVGASSWVRYGDEFYCEYWPCEDVGMGCCGGAFQPCVDDCEP